MATQSLIDEFTSFMGYRPGATWDDSTISRLLSEGRADKAAKQAAGTLPGTSPAPTGGTASPIIDTARLASLTGGTGVPASITAGQNVGNPAAQALATGTATGTAILNKPAQPLGSQPAATPAFTPPQQPQQLSFANFQQAKERARQQLLQGGLDQATADRYAAFAADQMYQRGWSMEDVLRTIGANVNVQQRNDLAGQIAQQTGLPRQDAYQQARQQMPTQYGAWDQAMQEASVLAPGESVNSTAHWVFQTPQGQAILQRFGLTAQGTGQFTGTYYGKYYVDGKEVPEESFRRYSSMIQDDLNRTAPERAATMRTGTQQTPGGLQLDKDGNVIAPGTRPRLGMAPTVPGMGPGTTAPGAPGALPGGGAAPAPGGGPAGQMTTPQAGPALAAGGQPTAGAQLPGGQGAAPAAGGAPSQPPQPGAFTPAPFQPPSTPVDVNAIRRLANLVADEQYSGQASAVLAALDRAGVMGQRAAQALRDELGQVQEQNRTRLAAQGLLDSGYLSGANAQAQAAFGRGIGEVQQNQQLAEQQARQQIIDIERLRGITAARSFEELRREERQFGLQERGQALAEYLGVNQLQLQSMDQNFQQQMARSRFQEDVRQFGLQYALDQARTAGDLAWQTAQTEALRAQEGRAGQMFPAELEGQQILNRQRLQEISQGAQRFDLEQEATRLANQAATLQNQVAEIEAALAADPDVGIRAQLEQELANAKARLQQTNSELSLSQRRLDLESRGLDLREREIGLREAEGPPLRIGSRDATPTEQRTVDTLAAAGLYDIGSTTDVGELMEAVQAVMNLRLGTKDEEGNEIKPSMSWSEIENHYKAIAQALRASGVDVDAVLRWIAVQREAERGSAWNQYFGGAGR